jgi:predicted permease
LHATRTDLTPALKEDSAPGSRRYRRLNARNLLVVSQVAGSLMLLTITGFLVLGHRRIADTGTGFDPQGLYLLSMDPVRDGYTAEETAALMPKLLDRIQRLPFATSAALANAVPMQMVGRPQLPLSAISGNGTKMLRDGVRFLVSRDYFATIGIPILRGRGFRPEDEAGSDSVAIISERLAQDCFKGEDPLGRRIEIGNERTPEFQVVGAGSRHINRWPPKPQVFQVVGVARNVRDGLIMASKEAPPVIYLPLRAGDYSHSGLHGITVLLRAAPGVDALGAMRREIATMDVRLAPFDGRTMPAQIEGLLFAVRMALYTYGLIGICSLILASVGLAGVTAYTVARRTREIGIRIAVGAQRSDILTLVMMEGVVMIGIGTVIGLAGAHAGMRLLAGIFSQVARSADTGTSGPLLDWGCPLLLAGLGLAAAWLPASKSLRIDPAVTLRQE